MPSRLASRAAVLSALIASACSTGAAPVGRGVGAPAASGPHSGTVAQPAAAGAASGSVGLACSNAAPLVVGRTERGSTSDRRDLFHASCAYGAASPDAVYRFHVDAPSHVIVRVAGAYDTVVHLRAACTDDDSEIACNDDAPMSRGQEDTRRSLVEADVPPGDYYAIVDGFASGNSGFYSITLNTQPARVDRPLPRLARTAPGEGVTVQRAATAQGAITGAVGFAKRGYTTHGLTRATTDTPAPHVVVEAVDATGRAVATSETDDHGEFRLDVAAGATVRVRAQSRTTYLGNDIRVVSDPGTERAYELSSLPFRVAGGERVVLSAAVGGDVEPAGAFNIITQFVRYLPFIDRAFHRPLPTLYAFWRRGNNHALPEGTITAFLMDYHRHAGTFALQIQGGEAHREDASDSDQFDDPVILHEFSHFVVHTLAGDFSIGGMHYDGTLLFPATALDEGAATALATAVTGDGHYWDSAGVEPEGEILVDDDSETMTLPDKGIGSQNTAQTLVWDLMDGAEGLPDRDHDGVGIGLSGMLRIYQSFHDDQTSFPAVNTVLDRAIALHLITLPQASRLVRTPIDQGFSYPLATRDQWPIDLALPSAEVQGRVDGQTQPAPSGGRNVSSNGLDAIRTYRLRVTQRARIDIDLTIQGAGTQASGTDVDLQLYTRNLAIVARSQTERPTESLRPLLDPGTYILLVRDGDEHDDPTGRAGPHGNRASYTLRVHQATDFHY